MSRHVQHWSVSPAGQYRPLGYRPVRKQAPWRTVKPARLIKAERATRRAEVHALVLAGVVIGALSLMVLMRVTGGI